MKQPVIEIQHIMKSFQVGQQLVPVLKDVSLTVNESDFLILFGPSGCGKSTLLHTILGLEAPTAGNIVFLGKDLYKDLQAEDDRSDFRKMHIGMVYQQPNWIRSLTVLENVAFPLLLLGEDRQLSVTKATAILKTVEMVDWANYAPTELSSGQQQRVALARALISNPSIIIADEPTGNLDYESGQDLMKLLRQLNDQQQKTIIMVTHDLEYLEFAKTAIRMFNGTIAGSYEEKDKKRLLAEVKSEQSGRMKKEIQTA